MARPTLRLDRFAGIIPKIAPKLLPEFAAQTAENCLLQSGRLVPLKDKTLIQASTGDETIFLWKRNVDAWLTFDDDVDIVRSMVADDETFTLFLTGDSKTANGTTPNALKYLVWDGGQTLFDSTPAQPNAPSAIAADIFDRSTVSLTGQTTIASASFNNPGSDAGDTIDATLVDSKVRDDGRLEYRFRFADQKFAQLVKDDAHLTGYAISNVTKYLITISGGVGTIPNAGAGINLQGDSLELSDGGDVYATFQVEEWNSPGYRPVWNFADTPATGVPTGNTADCTIPSYDLVLVIAMNFTESADTSDQRYYVQTLVDKYGNEGPASDYSNIVTRKAGQKVTVSMTSDPPAAGKRRLYRSAAGSVEDAFFYVTETTDLATATYVDTKQDAELSEPLPKLEAPANGMKGLVIMPSGFMAAFKGREVYFSEPYIPASWPSEYRLTIPSDIVALGVSGNDLIVMTVEDPWLIQGTHPESMSQNQLPIHQACVSKKGVSAVGTAVVYPCPDGLVAVTGGQADLVTKNRYDEDSWSDIVPSGLVGAVHDNAYYGFAAATTIIIDFSEGDVIVTTSDELATAAYTDMENDTLYILASANIYSWGTSATSLSATWKSKKFVSARPKTYVAGKVVADSYAASAVTMILYGDGSSLRSAAVVDATDFRLQAGGGGKLDSSEVWEIELVTTQPIDDVTLVERVVQQIAQGVREIRVGNEVSWLALEFTFPRVGTFVVAAVEAKAHPVTLRLYPDNTLKYTASPANSQPFKILDGTALLESARVWEADVVGTSDDTNEIDELVLIAKVVEPADGPVRIIGDGSQLAWLARYFAFPRVATPAVAAVNAKTFPVTFTIFQDQTQVYTKAVADPAPFKILDGTALLDSAKEWQIDIVSDDEINEVTIVPKTVQPVTSAIRVADQAHELSWLARYFEFPRAATITVAIVSAKTYPVTLTLFQDQTSVYTTSVTDATPFKVLDGAALLDSAKEWQVDVASDDEIDQVVLIAKVVAPIKTGIREIGVGDQFTWLAKYYRFPRLGAFIVGSIDCKTYPVTVRIYREGTLVYTKAVANARDFKILDGSDDFLTPSENWNIDIVSDDEIDEVLLLDRPWINSPQGLMHVVKDGDRFSWLQHRFQMPRAMDPVAVRVRAASYPVTLTLYNDTVEAAEYTVASDVAFKVPKMRPEARWEFDATGNQEIFEVTIASSMTLLRSV